MLMSNIDNSDINEARARCISFEEVCGHLFFEE
jgi:hypothetical protein